MPRYTTLLLALATLSVTASAQNADPAGPAIQSQPAPIERAAPHQMNRRTAQTTVSQPALGILVRSAQNSSVRTVLADAHRTELRVDHGRANVNVHRPAGNTEILVDLPGGQTAILKDGLYTFNADTNTVRVLKGEAKAFPGPADSKPIKVKEYHQLVFSGSNVRSVEVDPAQARADLLPGGGNPERRYGNGFYPQYPYGDGYYGYGYPYPYYSYGYPYGFYGYPYGFGYPFGFGIGFGFRGGFHGHR